MLFSVVLELACGKLINQFLGAGLYFSGVHYEFLLLHPKPGNLHDYSG